MSDKSDTPRTDALQEELASMNGPEGLYTEEMADRMWFLMAELEGKLTFLYANCIGDSMALGIMQLQRNELAQARAEVEQLRVQLAGCGVIAGCNTRRSLSEQMPTPDAYGYSASLLDVAKAVTREMNERERADKAEAENKALREDARPFPMQDGPPIPWSLAKIIYAGYSALFGTNQSLERLAERGGFGWSEVSGIYNHPRTRAAIDAARKG